VIFDEPTDKFIDIDKVKELAMLLQMPEPIDPRPFLCLPNATKEKIKNLHTKIQELK